MKEPLKVSYPAEHRPMNEFEVLGVKVYLDDYMLEYGIKERAATHYALTPIDGRLWALYGRPLPGVPEAYAAYRTRCFFLGPETFVARSLYAVLVNEHGDPVTFVLT